MEEDNSQGHHPGKQECDVDCSNDVHDVTDIIGSFKKWQMWIFAATFYFELVSANIANTTIFLVPGNLDYWCKGAKKEFHSQPHGKPSFGENICWSYVNGTKTECTSWEYDRTTYSSSLVEKWDLVCDRNWLVSFSMTVTIFGDFFGCLLFGYLADREGRRKTMLIALAPALLGSVGTFFAPGVVTFFICRFLCGAAGLGFITCSFVLMMEVVGPSVRSAVGNGIKVGLTLGGIFLGITGYFFRYWQLIQLASTLPLVGMIIICWLLPESPRWLLSKNRVDQATEILTSAAIMNKMELSDIKNKAQILTDRLLKEASRVEKQNVTLWKLLRTRNMRIKTILMIVMWLVSGFASHSLLMNLVVFGKNQFLGPGMVMMAEFPGILFGHFLFKRFGCKWTNQVSWMCLTLVTFGIAFTKNSGYWTLMCCLSMMKIITAIISNGLYIQTTEIFPTVARTIGLGTCSSFARISAMASPFLKEMYQRFDIGGPFFLLSALSLVASTLAVFLPNTHGHHLPETIEDAERVPLYTFCNSKRSMSNEELRVVPLQPYGTGSPDAKSVETEKKNGISTIDTNLQEN